MDMKSTLIKNLLSITCACLLIVFVKANALLQYWQQTHHSLLQVEQLPALTLPASVLQPIDYYKTQWNVWIAQYQSRMLLAGKLLLMGDAVLPRVEVPVVVTSSCPEPAAVVAPVCSESKVVIATKNTSTGMADSSLNVQPQLSNDLPGGEFSLLSGLNTLEEQVSSVTDILVDPTSPISLSPSDQVLLIGDSLMQGVAPHLIISFKRKYGVQAIDLSRQSTGLTYPGFFNWPKAVNTAFEQQHYAVVVVFLGANDPWDMTVKGHYIRFGSDQWEEIYRKRVAKIIALAAEQKTQVIWLGAPPMGREDLVGKASVLNAIYQNEIAKQPYARFISTSSTLTTDGETFTKFIELPERGSVMVRTDDGVHFTPQGQRMLAALTLNQFELPKSKITKR